MSVMSLRRARALALVSTAFTTLSAGMAHAQAVLPSGGSVVAGQAGIASDGTTTTVKQTTDRAVIDWRGFDVGAGHGVVFAQPGSGSATLNRVIGTSGSTIAGSITSNGAVFLVNPNGIAITSTGTVQTGGGFVASTLDIADADFMGGKLNFAGTGGSVSNAGRISAGAGAYVALLGGTVSNSGVISVPMGKVAMGAGTRATLDLNGDGFLQVAAPASVTSAGVADAKGRVAIAAGTLRNALRNVVNMPQDEVVASAVSVRGGGILLGGMARVPVAQVIAPALAAAPATQVSMSGTINVDSATGNAGRVELIAAGGTANVSRSLSARATGATGNGGLVETSGAKVDFTGLHVDTRAANGKTGTWLIDPTDLTVDDAAAATISDNLETSDVSLSTNLDGASGTGNQTAGNGDININSSILWSSANTLSLTAYNNINLNAAILGAAGGLTLSSGYALNYAGTISDTAAINVNVFNIANGNWVQNAATLPIFSATDFRFDVTRATFLRATGGDGSTATPYQIADVYGLQGLASVSLLASNFVLANAIDASVTATWNAGAGFVPIGTDGAGGVYAGEGGFSADGTTGFTGTVDGAAFSVQNLTINRSGSNYGGLFGFTSGQASLSNIGLTNVSVNAGAYTGGLLGQGTGTTTLANDTTTGWVYATNLVGGLVGFLQGGSIADSSSAAKVVGTLSVGGLAGTDYGATSDSYATGVIVQQGTGSGTGSVGGLVGDSNATASFQNVYATGNVTGEGVNVGGLIGNATGTIASSYASGTVRGNGNVGGLVGRTTGSVTTSNASGNVSGALGVGGLIGLTSAAVSGSSASGNVTATGSYAGGLIGQDAATTAANGVSGSSASGAVSSTGQYAGGLIGYDGAPVSASFASGNVTGSTNVGGLIGYTNTTTANVDQTYASGAVASTLNSGAAYAGGLIGNTAGAITVGRSYATGAVTGNSASAVVGGLIGLSRATITQSYATGAIGATAQYRGGLVGQLAAGSVALSDYWDSYSTGLATAVGVVQASGAGTATQVTSDPAQAGAANYAFKRSAYANLTQADWVFFDGQTRPFGAWEVPANVYLSTLANSHQLQLLDANATTLAGVYKLGASIDLAEMGRNTGTAATSAGMWAQTGFVPIGTDGAGNRRSPCCFAHWDMRPEKRIALAAWSVISETSQPRVP